MWRGKGSGLEAEQRKTWSGGYALDSLGVQRERTVGDCGSQEVGGLGCVEDALIAS